MTVPRPDADRRSPRARRLANRTAQLPRTSRVLYRIEHYSSLPSIAMTVVGTLLLLVILGASLGFPSGWVSGIEVGSSVVTLAMVFVIQHTQGREQAATQRKLDELLRATPGAAEALMMLEEAPREVMIDVEESQRDTRADSVDEDAD
jgi:low affinity Fe/Cu permease